MALQEGTQFSIPGMRTMRAVWKDFGVVVYDTKNKSRDDKSTKGYSGAIVEVQWESSKWNSTTRKLVNQSYVHFVRLQEAAAGPNGAQADVLVKCSRHFRAILHECVLELKKIATAADCDAEVDCESYVYQCELFSMMELIWHLCEILYLEVLPFGCLIQQLLEWVRWHSTSYEQLQHDVISAPCPEEHQHFWHLVYKLVLQGSINEARDVLGLHSFAHHSPKVFESMDELLTKMPMMRSSVTASKAELLRSWQEWRGECCRRRDRGDFMLVPELQLLCQGVLCGEEEALLDKSIVESCDEWYELMVGQLLFTSPLVLSTDYDVVATAEKCLGVCEAGGAVRDKILLSALQGDVMNLITLCSASISNWWFVAHLTTIFHQGGILVASQLEYGFKLSEFLVLEYASSIMSHPSLWPIALGYLGYCPTQGRHYQSLYVERIPLTSERKAIKVLRVCNQYQLKEEAKTVCRVMAVRAYRSGRLGVALSWSLRSKDAAFAAALAEKYFDSYQSLGEFMDLDLLDHLGSAMLLSNKLAFLGKYREFHRLYGNGEFVAAGQLLVQLLVSNIVPMKFWMTILTDALPLLELESPVFNTEQTYALAHFLRQLSPIASQSLDHTAEQDTGSQDGNNNKVSLLWLALVRNLSRAMLEAPSP
ncbi:hypothetical protein EMCRGX_G028483 [Ephydatia muelleri]